MLKAEGTSGRGSFFRQSGWMLMTSFGSGLLLYGVHKFASQMGQGETGKAEYGAFYTLLQVLNMMVIPAMGLQMTFAQQTVSALAEADRRQLVGTARGVLKAAVWVFLALCLVVFVSRDHLVADYKISNPAALWITVMVGFLSVCLPVFSGILQGQMNFLWLGWSSLFNAGGRLLAIFVLVALLHGFAAAAMTGVLVGMALGVGTAAWHSRQVWMGPSEPIQWSPWLVRVIPLSLGYGAATILLSWDAVVVRRYFPEEQTGLYAAAGLLGRALLFLTAPLTWVMFPRIVQSAARAEKTYVMVQALGVTGLVGGIGALCCTFIPELPLRIMYDESYVKVAAPLLRWFGWCVLPLTLANVLLNNLLARRQFAVVPWLVILAMAYAVVLWLYHPSLRSVIQTLGSFGFLFFAICLFFTWRGSQEAVQEKKPD